MLSTVRLGALKACSNGPNARSLVSSRNTTGYKPSRPSFLPGTQSSILGLQSRSYTSSSFEEGDQDREENAFHYFYRKIRLGDEQEPEKSNKKSSAAPRVKSTSAKKPAPKVEEKPKTPIEKKEIRVSSEDAGSRMDRFVSRLYPKLPNARIQKLLRDKKVCPFIPSFQSNPTYYFPRIVVLDGESAFLRCSMKFSPSAPHSDLLHLSCCFPDKITVMHPGAEHYSKVEGNERLRLGSIVRLRGTIDSYDGMRPSGKDEVESTQVNLPKDKIDEVRSWVIHKDDNIIVLNKPANLAVQGGSGIKESIDDLAVALKYEKTIVPKLVHRLDRGASGLLVLARDRPTAQALTKRFEKHDISKLYWAVCIGVPKRLAGSVKVGLRKEIISGEDSERVVVVELPSEGEAPSQDKSVKPSHSRYHTVAHTHKSMSLLALRPRTGRTHQLRVHCADVLHTPIFGDYKYGKGVPDHLHELLGTDAPKHGVPLHLHAREIAFKHPGTEKFVHFVAPVPKHFKETMNHFDYHLMTGDSPYATLSQEEKQLEPYEYTFKEGKLKQKLRLNKLAKTDEYKKEKRREHAVREKLETASKGNRARLQKLKQSGELTLKSFKPKSKPSSSYKGSRGPKKGGRR